MIGLEALKELKHWKETNNENGVVWLPLFVVEDIEKTLKALEIIKKKKVDMWHLVDLLEQTYEMYVAFCKSEKYEEDYILTEEEFNLFKEVLE